MMEEMFEESYLDKKIVLEQMIQKIKIICHNRAVNGSRSYMFRRFSLYLFEGFTLEEVGQLENVTGECVRHNINIVLRILRRPEYNISLTYKKLKLVQEYIVMQKILSEGGKK
jgi:predicted DNA-binding protein YlxM (UPF0122 family)